MVHSTSTIALAAFLLQAMTVISTPLQLSPLPVESTAPDSIGSFGPGWSTSPVRSPLPIQQPPSRPSFRVGTTQLGPLFPKYTYQGIDSDLHTRSDLASDVADLAKFLNSRDVEKLDTRGFRDVLGKIFGKLGPLLLQRREVDDEAMAQLEHLLQSRELADELEARGLFSFLPKLFSVVSKGRNAADTILSPATPPSPPAPTASNAPAPQRRSDDIQALNRLFSRYLAEDERQGTSIHRMFDRLIHLPAVGSLPIGINGHSLVNNQPLGAPEPAPSLAPQRRAVEDDIKELERLLGREMTDVEHRGLGTKLGQAAPFAPLLFQGFDWIKDHIGNYDSPAQPVESAAPQ